MVRLFFLTFCPGFSPTVLQTPSVFAIIHQLWAQQWNELVTLPGMNKLWEALVEFCDLCI